MTSRTLQPTEQKNPFTAGIVAIASGMLLIAIILWFISASGMDNDSLKSALFLNYAGTWFGWAVLAFLTALVVEGINWKLGAIEYRTHMNAIARDKAAAAPVSDSATE